MLFANVNWSNVRRGVLVGIVGLLVVFMGLVVSPARTVFGALGEVSGKSCELGLVEGAVPLDHRADPWTLEWKCFVNDAGGVEGDRAAALMVQLGTASSSWDELQFFFLRADGVLSGKGCTTASSYSNIKYGDMIDRNDAVVTAGNEAGYADNYFTGRYTCHPSYTGTNAKTGVAFWADLGGWLFLVDELHATQDAGNCDYVPGSTVSLASGTSDCVTYLDIEGANLTNWAQQTPEPFVDQPGSPCLEFDVTYETYEDGVWNTRLSYDGVLLSDGDAMRVTIDSSTLTAPYPATTWFASFGVNPYQAIAGTSSLTTALPVQGEIVHTGTTIDARHFEMYCRAEGFPDFWYEPGTGWSDPDTPPAPASICSAYYFSMRTSVDDRATWRELTSVENGFVQADDWIQVTTFLESGRQAQNASLDVRLSRNGAWLALAEVGVPTVFPYVVEFQATEAGQLLDGSVRCRSSDGIDVTVGPNGVPIPVGDSESCMEQTGMSLTSPSTWVRGLGRMAVCLVEYLFVPTSLDSFVEEQHVQYSPLAPFSFFEDTVEIMDTATAPGGSSTPFCLSVDDADGGVQVGSTEVCADVGATGLSTSSTQQDWMLAISLAFTVIMGVISMVWMLF